MARNASGTYSLPVAAFAAGTTIRSADVNSNFSDIATTLTDSLSVSGKGGMSAPLQAVGGTLAAPGYAFGSDTKTGMWLSGAHQIQFSMNGVAGLTLNTDLSASFPGNVSITGSLSVGSVTGAIPAGALMAFAGFLAPPGWLLCYGQTVAQAAYPDLFTIIGTIYGGGGGNFVIPDLRGRLIFGVDNMGGVSANRLTGATDSISSPTIIGSTGGTETHTLSQAEMPVHNHGVTDPGHVHSVANTIGAGAAFGGAGALAIATENTGSAGTNISIQNAGSGNAHNNVPPGMVLNYIIKT